MKKLLTIIATLVALVSCAPSRNTYIMEGTTADNDLIITEDGNAWDVTTDIVIGSSVVVTFDNNGTPDYVFDDIITSVVVSD